MTTTGPLPAVRQEPASAERMAALVMAGSPFKRGLWYSFTTADAVIDQDHGILYVACDLEPEPADWAAVCGLIRAVGWDNGGYPHDDDPGEPVMDALAGVYTWRLQYVR